MKRIVFPETKEAEVVAFSDVRNSALILAKRDEKILGVVVKENSKGWIIRTGGEFGVSGHHESLLKCLENGATYGYEFYTQRP